jgi:hypothetical protein
MEARCDRVPGYRCDRCDVEFYVLPASIQVLEAALRVVKQAGDDGAAARVKGFLATKYRSPFQPMSP